MMATDDGARRLQDIANDSDLFQCFGGEYVHELGDKGNPMLTRGSFGEISLAVYNNNGDDNDRMLRLVVVKTLLQSAGWSLAATPKRKVGHEVVYEVAALRMLANHPHIATLMALYPSRDEFEPGTYLSLAFEYCPSDLQLSLEWRRRSFLPLLWFGAIKTISRDIFSALQYCHQKHVIHRDVKCGNFLVTSTGRIQLCDFGLAKPALEETSSGNDLPRLSAADEQSRGLCTMYYRSPEVLLGSHAAHPSVDIYSAGTVIAELILGRPLFAGRTVLDQLTKVFESLGTPTEKNWPGARNMPDYGKLTFVSMPPKPIEQFIPRALENDHLVDFLQSIITLDPTQRLTSVQAAEHPWLHQSGQANRSVVVEELIPRELDEPILLSSPDGSLSVASRQALSLAETRRGFLTKLKAAC